MTGKNKFLFPVKICLQQSTRKRWYKEDKCIHKVEDLLRTVVKLCFDRRRRRNEGKEDTILGRYDNGYEFEDRDRNGEEFQ